ncbi:MAG: hypothetical protein Tsb0021_07000 [Chlamydiales bacterium]
MAAYDYSYIDANPTMDLIKYLNQASNEFYLEPQKTYETLESKASEALDSEKFHHAIAYAKIIGSKLVKQELSLKIAAKLIEKGDNDFAKEALKIISNENLRNIYIQKLFRE